jgi:hypothetical protein
MNTNKHRWEWLRCALVEGQCLDAVLLQLAGLWFHLWDDVDLQCAILALNGAHLLVRTLKQETNKLLAGFLWCQAGSDTLQGHDCRSAASDHGNMVVKQMVHME